MSAFPTMTAPDPAHPPIPTVDDTVAVVFAGGDALDAEAHERLRRSVEAHDGRRPLVVAADSGLHAAQDGGWVTDLVVGDLDSVDPDRLAAAEAAGARVERHPTAKDATDLELALDSAIEAGARRVVVAGGHGGRFDHLLANLLLLGSDRFASVSVSALMGVAWLHVVRRAVTWPGDRGDLVTLLALHGPVAGVTTSGLLYPLDRATLHPGSTRGVSNEQLDARAGVSVESGVLIVVRPGERGAHVLEADPGPVAGGDP